MAGRVARRRPVRDDEHGAAHPRDQDDREPSARRPAQGRRRLRPPASRRAERDLEDVLDRVDEDELELRRGWREPGMAQPAVTSPEGAEAIGKRPDQPVPAPGDEVRRRLRRDINPVMVLVETARGIHNVEDIAASGASRIAFGTLDYAVDLDLSGDERGPQKKVSLIGPFPHESIRIRTFTPSLALPVRASRNLSPMWSLANL